MQCRETCSKGPTADPTSQEQQEKITLDFEFCITHWMCSLWILSWKVLWQRPNRLFSEISVRVLLQSQPCSTSEITRLYCYVFCYWWNFSEVVSIIVCWDWRLWDGLRKWRSWIRRWGRGWQVKTRLTSTPTKLVLLKASSHKTTCTGWFF